jgi:20S proteasome alpha/beta subunit
MTVCIAAIAGDGNSICLVTDSKASFGTFSADKAARKQVPLIYHYAVLFAGNDAAYAVPVIERAKKRLSVEGQPTVSSADEISECIFEECQKERDRLTEAEILRPHGYDWATFRQQGKDLCTDAVFYDIHTALQKRTLSLDFIIAGFDNKNQAHIRFTNCTTPPEDYDSIGFWAIGTGAQAALSSLAQAVEYLSMSRFSDAETVLYHTLAAKFMAESARDVGRDTTELITLASGESGLRFLNPFGGVDYIRKRWEKEGAPKTPRNISRDMADLLVNNVKHCFTAEKLETAAKHSPTARKLLSIRNKNSAKQLASEKSVGQP